MKIIKLTQKNAQQYIIKGEDQNLLFYAETIIKFALLNKKEIPEVLLDEIKKYDNCIKIFYDAIAILKRKRKTEKEITALFIDKKLDIKMVNELIEKLKKMNLINDSAYLNAYIHDSIYLKKKGPIKIEKELVELGFKREIVESELEKIPNDVWLEIINNYITKKLKANHNTSGKVLRQKIIFNLKLNGFSDELINKEISRYQFNDSEILKKEYLHQEKVLMKKYSGIILENNIKKRLLQKGFFLEDIEYFISKNKH